MNFNFLRLRSLKTRLTLFMLVVFLISIWSLAFHTSRMLREDMQRMLSDQQFSSVSLLAAKVNQELDGRLRVLEKIVGNISPAMLKDAATLQTFLEQHILIQNLFNGGAFVTGTDGTATASIPLSVERIGRNYMDRDYISATLKDGKSLIGQPVMGRALSSPIFAMSVPIRDISNNVIGALAGVTDLGKLNFLDIITEGNYGKTGGYFLVAPQYRLIITASDKTRVMEQFPAPGVNPVLDEYLQGKEGSDVYVNPLGVEVLGSAKRIPVAGWFMGAILPTQEAFAPIRAMQQRMLLSTIFMSLLVGILTRWILTTQLSPMLAAARTLAIQSGTNQPLQPLQIIRQDEIGELVGGFNLLLKTLKQRDDSLRESEEKHREMIANISDVIAIMDRDGTIRYKSPNIEKWFGWQPKELVGTDGWETVHPEDIERLQKEFFTLLDRDNSVATVEYRYKCKDGSYKLIELTAVNLTNDPIIHGVLMNYHDITARKQIEDALLNEKNFSEAIIESIPGMLYVYDDQGKHIRHNERHEKMTGYSAEELSHLNPFSWYDNKADVIRVEAAINDVFTKGYGEVEVPMRIKNGQHLFMHFTGSRLVMNGKKYFVGVGTDITERKAAEKALQESNDLLKLFIRHSPVYCYIKEVNSTRSVVLQASDNFRQMIGIPGSEMFGKTMENLYPPEFASKITADDWTVVSKGDVLSLDEEFNGRRYTTIKFPIAHGDKTLLAGYTIDITERKRAEESLRESEERLRSAQRIGKLGSLDWNLATNELLLSEETVAIFGLQKGKNIFEIEEIISLLHPEDKQRVEKSLNDAIANKARHDLEHRIIRPNGEVIYIRAMAELFHATDKKPLRLMGTIRDITDRKQSEMEKAELEAQNRQLQKAESLGRMAGAIAHHFNNQLYAVMGNLEMAMDDLPRGADISETLAEAQKAAHKAAEVSRMMLTYLGQSFGKHEPIDLTETCRQSITLLQAAFPKGMGLNTDFPTCGPVILADVGQIRQVLINLITNAWEATGENKGTIDLTVKTVSHEDSPSSKRFPIDWQPREIDYACLEVSDTGGGIANKDIEKIFDPFFTTKFTGRGLGLPVVLGIVKSHGGGITVESEPGQGSTFRIFLPVSTEKLPLQHGLPVTPETQPTSKAEELSKIEGGGTVLLIEDEDQVRNLAKMMLTRLGYKVLDAKDGAESVDIFQKHQNEIIFVLSDLTMPRMDGWETLVALRRLSPNIPVVLSSGYDEAQVMAGDHTDHTEQPNAFLGKPYQLKGLRETINRVLAAMDSS